MELVYTRINKGNKVQLMEMLQKAGIHKLPLREFMTSFREMSAQYEYPSTGISVNLPLSTK
jgi:hypothetical protein